MKVGRKQRFKVGDRVVVNDRAPDHYRGRRGRVSARGPGRGEYRVAFGIGAPAVGYLQSYWLEPLSRRESADADTYE